MNKKMILTAALTACMLAGVCYFPVRDIAQNVTLDTAADAYDDGWRYRSSSTSTYCIEYAGRFPNGELYIPASIYFESWYDHAPNDGQAHPADRPMTTGTYQMVFSGFDRSVKSGSVEKSELRTVTMEDGARFGGIIGNNSVFSGCANLSSVRLPSDLPTIPSSCFSGCTSLASIDIPASVTEIGSSAFSGTALKSITLPEKLVSLNGFSGCTGLTSISIPASVTEIGSSAFSGCTGFTEFTVPENVKKIGSSAFAKCKNLKSITIENPSCEIYDDVKTIYGSYDYDTAVGNYRYNWDGTIYGYAGSTAEAYAKKYGWNFAVIGSTPTQPDTPAQTPPLAPAGSYYGDVDGDGEITAADAQNVLMYAVEAMTGNRPSWKEITGNTNAPS